ncbi:complex I NDUFA9 subunit family protein [Halomonas sp. MCCC 1A17488]|uniref:Complex I NDUFA9 subunit family protein n=1 Tax=Billgrantia sulfidoxydans TaxID=2733484 RepID=A0ABX7W809_9GAMM|nr:MULTISPECIES: complex I NDUFA9 subunit family protein [Halomonas]MCE8014491.1 complex I NDUFA9 subunit family protein [Halomonas sp. MCCC 1A17488]MCG3237824.1 complex I NDUFA9 subunit family protein [Halomonas sp. MCCC 1A17488]QPP48382.1 complex I NDUFA9 subunit family protein [Halomonas sp. SS10-MC5]QTP55692.1 complex I NDUFA9 subunit family protein [Halomonas sulfidoxydans]
MARAPITVFGGTGFLGRHVVQALFDAGHAVRIAARRPALPDWAEPGDPLEPMSLDIRSESDVSRALEGARGVVNAVSLYVERGQASFDQVHVEGAGRLARLARAEGVPTFIQLSGIGAATSSRSRYVRARGRGESAVIDAYPKAIILRPSVMFGRDDAFLNRLAELTRLPVIPLFGHGETRLQPVHVVDVARAIVRLMGAAPSERRLFELGGLDILSYREILELVMAHLELERRLLPVPFPLWQLVALLASPLPGPPLTRDQVIMMAEDNTVGEGVGTFADLDILPRSLRDALPACLPERR